MYFIYIYTYMICTYVYKCIWHVGARTDGRASTNLARRLRDPLAAMRRYV